MSVGVACMCSRFHYTPTLCRSTCRRVGSNLTDMQSTLQAAAALSLSRPQVQRHSIRAGRSNRGPKPKTLNLMNGAFRCKASAFLLPRLKVNLHTYNFVKHCLCMFLTFYGPFPKPQVTLMTWLLSFFVPSPAGASPCTFFESFYFPYVSNTPFAIQTEKLALNTSSLEKHVNGTTS